MNNNSPAVDWLKRQYKIEISELGANVAEFLDKMWGIHNCNRTSLSKVDWSNDTWIEVVIGKIMSTVDNNDLTRLVVIAHQMMLRIELKGVGPGYIKLQFHQRTRRENNDGTFWRWCPHIEDHVEMIAKHHQAKE
jgi:hypothetical protein